MKWDNLMCDAAVSVAVLTRVSFYFKASLAHGLACRPGPAAECHGAQLTVHHCSEQSVSID
jgi:hypothetical protein